jgi:hypothetical protein
LDKKKIIRHYSFNAVDAIFPPIEKIIPNKDREKIVFNIQRESLELLLKATDKETSFQLELDKNDISSVISVRFDNQDINTYGLVMPYQSESFDKDESFVYNL